MIRTVQDLHSINEKRKKDAHQIYKTIFIDMMTKINKKNDQQAFNMLYKPPTVVMGNINYNHKTCMLYLIRKLSKTGFIVFPMNHNLYIDWSIDGRDKVRKKVTFNI